MEYKKNSFVRKVKATFFIFIVILDIESNVSTFTLEGVKSICFFQVCSQFTVFFIEFCTEFAQIWNLLLILKHAYSLCLDEGYCLYFKNCWVFFMGLTNTFSWD